jgi:hypothetical protein
MEQAELLEALLELAHECALPVRRIPAEAPFEGLVPPQSGSCVLRGRRLVLLCGSDPLERRIEVLAGALREHAGPALEMRFLPPAIRECLQRGA